MTALIDGGETDRKVVFLGRDKFGFWRGLMLLLAVSMVGLAGCATSASLRAAPRPETDVTPRVETQVRAALAAGDSDTIRETAQDIHAWKQDAEAKGFILELLKDDVAALGPGEIRDGASLYLRLVGAEPSRLFSLLIHDPRLEVRRLAWETAYAHPSEEMAILVSRELVRRSTRAAPGSSGMSPEAAMAIMANDIKDAYPLLRTSLMSEGQVAYARAMIRLDPRQASDDLLVYLSGAQPEELRHGRLGKLRRAVCIAALGHFKAVLPSIHHPDFKYIFLYAASPDAALARPATAVLEAYAATAPREIVFLLAQVAPWARTAFLARLRGDNRALHGRLTALLHQSGV